MSMVREMISYECRKYNMYFVYFFIFTFMDYDSYICREFTDPIEEPIEDTGFLDDDSDLFDNSL